MRVNGRESNALRPVKISYNKFGFAPGSVLFELGNTKVLCAVTLQTGVPQFLKGKKVGWLTAEYSLLPTATQARTQRDGNAIKKNERAIEISRLIGRSLRAVVDLSTIGERTIYVDCDVLQADGSTRTAAISGAYLALKKAVACWLQSGEIAQNIITDSVAAVSVGWQQDKALLDLDYQEDNAIEADYNVVLTGSNAIIEIQGTAEKNAVAWDNFQTMMQCAQEGVRALLHIMMPEESSVKENTVKEKKVGQQVPLFSLGARLQKQATK